MNRIPIAGGWYCFGTLQGDWGALISRSHIQTSRGRIELPKPNGFVDDVVYLVGATKANGELVMGGQSRDGHGTYLYNKGEWTVVTPLSFGVSPNAFTQDGSWMFGVTDGQTGFRVNTDTGEFVPFHLDFFVDGIRGCIPPFNQLVLGNTTKFSPVYNLYEFLDYQNGFVSGQGPVGGMLGRVDAENHVIEPGECFFIRTMYDGNNIAIATSKQTENQAVICFLTKEELKNLPVSSGDPIAVIGKPMNFGWLEFNNHAPGVNTPLNCVMNVATGGDIRRDGVQFAQWIQAPATITDPELRIQSIEQQARLAKFTPVCYYDERTWPRWPDLPANAIICAQMYCHNDENMIQYEANQRAVLDSFPSRYSTIWGVFQCYDGNDGNTKDLKGLVPVFSRIFRDYSRLTGALGFSDEGRATGLNDHPELVPLYQELFRGITGVPMADNGVVDGILVDPKKYFFSLTKDRGENPANFDEVLDRIAPDLYKYGLGRQNNSQCESRPRLYLPTSICPNAAPNPDIPKEMCLGVKQVEACWEAQGRFANVTNDPPTEWIWDEHGGPAYQPINPNIPDPPPGDISVIILSYDRVTRRSDPNGMLVRFEGGPRAIVEAIFSTNSGERPKVVTFPVLPESDGRYFRALAVKLTINGEWLFQMQVKDDQGHIAMSPALPVTVTN